MNRRSKLLERSRQSGILPQRLRMATTPQPHLLARPHVKLQLLSHAFAAPSYETSGAAGADLAAAPPEETPIRIEPGARALVPTGVAIALPKGWEAQIRPRSGLAAREGLTVLNAPGTIDADYRGEIKVLLINLGDAPVTIVRGERIAQMIVAPAPQARFEQVESLDPTQRGDGGFGSTGRT